MKKRILIVDINCKIGGIQKALVNLLNRIHDNYDITLLLMHKSGALLSQIPHDVEIIETQSDFRYMGMSQSECCGWCDKVKRTVYALIAKTLGQNWAVSLMVNTMDKDMLGDYDVAISYSHITAKNSFYGGTAQYVLSLKKSLRKVCYVHCDYENSGIASAYSNGLYTKFDSIICVSESTKEHFLKRLPVLQNRTYALSNVLNYQELLFFANSHTVDYCSEYMNFVSIARLSTEKGIDRFIRAISSVRDTRIRYYIVGEGEKRKEIESLIEENDLANQVFLLGEDTNPYRYMLNADVIVVPSLHEAAPVVFQEARALRVPILTTRTTSAVEMVGDEYGFVVENSIDAITDKLHEIVRNPQIVYKMKEKLRHEPYVEDEKYLDMFDDFVINSD